MKPVKLNRRRLELQPNKDYAEVVFFGDLHLGAHNCDIERATNMLQYCYDNNVYVQLQGDLIESSNKFSPGDGVFRQINPNDQIEQLVELLQPLADKGLILGNIEGNHEARTRKLTGFSISAILSKILNVPYLSGAGWSLYYVGNLSYKVFCIHGKSGASTKAGKIAALMRLAPRFNADVIAHAHLHDGIYTSSYPQDIDLKMKKVVQRKRYFMITGHYQKYDFSYAQNWGLEPTRLGSPKVKFFGNRRDIHISF